MKVAIIGFGVAGQAAMRYWQAQGADVTVLDADPARLVPAGVISVLGDAYLDRLSGYDLIVRSPRIRPDGIRTKVPVTSQVKEFMSRCPARVIGITGSKGKSTTAALVSRILGEAGWRTWIGGDAGSAPLDFLAKVRASHLVVLEMSSWQLMDLDTSPNIGVCLPVAPTQLNWHRSLREYVAAIGNIFWHQTDEDLAVFQAHDEFAAEVGRLSPGRKLAYLEPPGAAVQVGRLVIAGTDICGVDEIRLRGEHNLGNICAAVTATWELVRQNPDPVRRAVKSFAGLSHRLELVLKQDGVQYYDDSYSTTPETVIAAIRAFTEPKVLILEGADKYSDWHDLAREVVDGNVRHVVLAGDQTGQVAAALRSAGFGRAISGPRTMAEIVGSARALAQPGDIVLWSPACETLGRYQNLADRGEQFQAAVKELK